MDRLSQHNVVLWLATRFLVVSLQHPNRPRCPRAVVAKLPALQSLMLPHNKLGGSLSCGLLASGKLAALDVTGAWAWFRSLSAFAMFGGIVPQGQAGGPGCDRRVL